MEPVNIAFISLGCDKNLYDSEVMLGIIDANGYNIVQNEEDADIIIVNTCGFIKEANEESIDNILRVAEYKQTGRLKAIIAAGCMVERYKDDIFKNLPEVDAVIGTNDIEKIADIIKEINSGKRNIMFVSGIEKNINPDYLLKRRITTLGGLAYLKIAEGCNNFCTYCTIPSIKGKYRSRPIEDIEAEAMRLSKLGVSELIIVAQDTALYGIDLYKEKTLSKLIRKLSEIDDIKWIRLMYCYPENIDDSLIDEIASNKKVLHYIDMPIQHSCDTVLKRMGRKSTKEKLYKVIKKLREKISDICIRTTVITGFPNETEKEFEELCNFIKDIRFDRLGVFAYSREEGTPAYNMDNQIDEEVKIKRKNIILDMQRDISEEKCKDFIGKEIEVIVEGRFENNGKKTYLCRSYRDCYEVDGYVFLDSENEYMSGDYVKVFVTGASYYDLIGVEADESAQ